MSTKKEIVHMEEDSPFDGPHNGILAAYLAPSVARHSCVARQDTAWGFLEGIRVHSCSAMSG